MNTKPAKRAQAESTPSYHDLNFWMVFTIVVPFAAGYFLSFFSRSANVVLVSALQGDLQISSGDIGLMSGAYFMAFALFQVPLGILLDRFDPAKVNALLIPFAVLGSVIFAFASGIAELIIGRALIGLGVSGCLMTAFRCFSLWMSVEKRARYNGIVVAVGGVGNLMAFYPVEYLIAYGFNWREIYIGMALLFASQSLLLWWLAPKKAPPKIVISLQEQKKHYSAIFFHPRFIAITPFACTVMAGFLAMQSLWFGPYLYEGVGLDKSESLLLITSGAVGAIFGNLAVGRILSLIRFWGGDFLVLMNGLSLLHFLILVLVAFFDFFLFWPFWLLMGFSYSAIVVYYAYLGRFLGSHLLGRAMTLGNGILFLLIFLFQVAFGYVLDLLRGTMGLEWSYRWTYTSLLAVYVLTFFWQIFYYKLYCRPLEEQLGK